MAGSTSEDEFLVDSDSEAAFPLSQKGGKDIVAIDSDNEPVQSGHRFSSVPWGRNVEELPGTLEAFAAAKDLQSTLRDDQRRRSFIKVLSTSSSQGNLMPFPTDFARNYMPLGRSTVTLVDENDRTWPAKWSWKPGQIHPGLNAKWKPFAAHHRLTRGDVVLIQLFDPAMLTFKVYVFKRKTHDVSVGKRKSRERQAVKMRKPRRVAYEEETVIKEAFIRDSEEETSESEEMVSEDGEECKDGKAEIRVSVECSRLKSAEKLGVKLVLEAAKVENIQRMLLGCANSSVRASQGGSFSAGIGKKELVKILKLAFPLDDGISFQST